MQPSAETTSGRGTTNDLVAQVPREIDSAFGVFHVGDVEHPEGNELEMAAEPHELANRERVERAATDAASRGLAVQFLVRERSGRPASDELGGAFIVKTIVVQRGDSFVFVLTPLEAQFSWAKLRAHLGVNRLSLPDAEAAFAVTGYERGTITPLGASTAWPVIVDASLAGTTVLVGAGRHGIAAQLRADDLVHAYGGEYVDLGDTATQRRQA